MGRDDLGDAAVEIIKEALETSGESMRALAVLLWRGLGFVTEL